jgi:nucleoside-diphosphate-sugar epimerase
MTDGLAGKCMNLGSEHEISMLDLAQIIARMVGQETGETVELCFEEGHPGDSKRRLPNLSSTEECLNWSAEVSLESGLVHTLRSML